MPISLGVTFEGMSYFAFRNFNLSICCVRSQIEVSRRLPCSKSSIFHAINESKSFLNAEEKVFLFYQFLYIFVSKCRFVLIKC